MLVEKPMALRSNDARAMLAAATQAKQVLMVGYNTRFQAIWKATQQLLQEGINAISFTEAVYRSVAEKRIITDITFS